MKTLLSTKDVAQLLDVNEKMVYALISEKDLPATKITGKWLFPRHLVEQWIERSTRNPSSGLYSCGSGQFVVAGSDDLLLGRVIGLYNSLFPDNLAAYGCVGSFAGLRALRKGLCHFACSHIMEEGGADFNFKHIAKEISEPVAVVNFCFREQGLLLAPGNPLAINSLSDLCKDGVRMVNRPLSAGTRAFFDQKLAEENIDHTKISGYEREIGRHFDSGLEVLSGRADTAPAIRAVAGILGLEFLPLGKERFDLVIPRRSFFEKSIQQFVGLFHEPRFRELASELQGYDISQTGRTVFPQEEISSES